MSISEGKVILKTNNPRVFNRKLLRKNKTVSLYFPQWLMDIFDEKDEQYDI